MLLSPHFSLEELTRSDAAAALDPPDANQPTAEHEANMGAYLATGLEAARVVLGDRAMMVHSGYRNPRVNRAVGGVPNSAHALGFAADIEAIGLTSLEAAKILAADAGFMRLVDQLIHETSRDIVHLSFDPHRLRGQVLTQAHGGGTAVTSGLA